MKQHAQKAMMLLAAFLGGTAEEVGALHRVHPLRSARCKNPLQHTATHNIAGWRLHVTISDRPIRQRVLQASTSSFYRLAVLDDNNRHVAVDVSYIGSSQGKARLGSDALWQGAPPVLSDDVLRQSQLHVADMPLFIEGSDPNSPWNRRFEPVGEHDDVMGIEAGMRPSTAEGLDARRRGPGSTRRDGPDLASVVGSPGVVLLNGLAVILIGHQMRRRLN